jgi:putative endonuclease
MKRKILGQKGEDLACAFLCGRGYDIIQRNFRCRYGEIDLIARQGETLVFIEVKTRMGSGYGAPEEAVTAEKQEHIRRVALFYLQAHPDIDQELRFDVIAISWGAESSRVNHIEGAF